MVASNVIGIDATFVEISFLNPNYFLVFRRAKNTPFIPDLLVTQKCNLFGFLQEMSLTIRGI